MQWRDKPLTDAREMHECLVYLARRIQATHARDHPTHDGPAVLRVTDSDANVDLVLILGDRADWRTTLRELDRVELVVSVRWRELVDRAPVLKETRL